MSETPPQPDSRSKLSALETAAFFEERRKRADFKAFRRILTRKGGEPLRPGDEKEK